MQPTALPLCGHACLAMVLGVGLIEAMKRMGHSRSTRTRELVEALGDRAEDKRLIPVRQRPIPEFAVLKVTWNIRRRSHFVVRKGSFVHDPLMPAKMLYKSWSSWLEGRGRVTSALKLKEE